MTKQQKETPIDIHWLYEASVQNVDTDLDVAKRIYAKHWKRKPLTLREDFCGTANLPCHWVARNKQNEAWGIDFHQATLDWGVKYNVAELSKEQTQRLHLICGDVLHTNTPKVDMALAFNFSFCIFKQRETLRHYFQAVAKSLNAEGLFVMDLYGGTESV